MFSINQKYVTYKIIESTLLNLYKKEKEPKFIMGSFFLMGVIILNQYKSMVAFRMAARSRIRNIR